ncbi:MAG: hypothetical protein HYX78_00845 [Armatimonadetes bacterium]|nr:hypothetical protein [Armatimonadota bacterium]
MRILVAVVSLACLVTSAYAATTPGTIVSTSAAASYADSSGQPMPLETSNREDILVVAASPPKPVMLTLNSLFAGASTIGRTVRVVGAPIASGGETWFEDGSTVCTDAVRENGRPIYVRLRCKLSTLFLSQPLGSQRIVVTGISQKDLDGIPVIIPSDDSDVAALAP